MINLHLSAETPHELYAQLQALLNGRTVVAYEVPAVALSANELADLKDEDDVTPPLTDLDVTFPVKPRLRRPRPKKADAAVLSAPSETFENFPTAAPTVAAPAPSTTKAELQAAFSRFATKSVAQARTLLDEFEANRFGDLAPENYSAFEARLIALGAAS